MSLVLDDILSSERYDLISEEKLLSDDKAAEIRTISLAKSIAKYEGDYAWMSTISRPLYQDKKPSVAEVQLKCKNLKKLGEVSFRAITGTSRYKYRGIVAWVVLIARKMVKRSGCSHMVLSSMDCKKKLMQAYCL